jgi:hypothetical protein
MASLEGEKPDINPKYVAKLIETRLYAIKDKKHIDGAIFTFYCPNCKHNNTIMKPLFFHNLTMDSFMHAVSGYRFETHKCVCGTKLSSQNMMIALYAHFFPDTKLDMQAELTSGSDFVSFYRMDLNGNRDALKNCMDLKCMYDSFGHVLSPRECWKHMIKSIQETKNIQIYNIERGYSIVAIRGDSPHANVNMKELAGPSWPGSSAYVLRFREYFEDPIDLKDTFIDWMPEYVDDIKKNRLDAAAIIDTAVLQEMLESTLRKEGVDFIIQGNTCYVDKKPFKAELPVREMVKEIVYQGKSFQEVIDDKIETALNSVFSAENLYNTLKRDMPSYDFTVVDDHIEVTNPRNGLMEKVPLYTMLPPGGARSIVTKVRETLSKNEEFRPVCKCGKEAFIIKSIEPRSWLSATEDSFNYVYEEKENAVIIYYVSCGEHMSPVKKTDLAEWLIERKDLDETFEKELDSLRINIETHAGAYGKDIIIGLLSRKACDIMVSPSFIKGLLDTMKVDMGDRVIVYAPLKEMVLIYREDADLENLNEAVTDLQNITIRKDITQTVLDHIEVFELDKGHGIFNIIILPDRPAEELTEETPKVSDGEAFEEALPGNKEELLLNDAVVILDKKKNDGDSGKEELQKNP